MILLRLLIRLYQWGISPMLSLFAGVGSKCRFEPTCSQYCLEAVETHGARGLLLAVRRILRCHPWGGCGYDPVPPAAQSRRAASRQ
jgi:putative membrane protein insertion efficiency factor